MSCGCRLLSHGATLRYNLSNTLSNARLLYVKAVTILKLCTRSLVVSGFEVRCYSPGNERVDWIVG